MVGNSSQPDWHFVISGVPQGSVLERMLFNIFINSLENGIESTLTKFVDDTKQGGEADTLEERATVQRDLKETGKLV